MEWIGHPTRGDDYRKGARIPFAVDPKLVHSLTLQLLWTDQGRGQRKGQFWIIGSTQSLDATAPPTGPFEGGRVVYESDMAPHTVTATTVSFTPVAGEDYSLWIKVGSGGGHRLILRDGKLHATVYDSVERHVQKNHQALMDAGVLSTEVERDDPLAIFSRVMSTSAPSSTPVFFSQLLLNVCQSLRAQLEADVAVDATMAGFLSQHGIAITTKSLEVVETLIRADLEEQERARASRKRALAPPPEGVNLAGIPVPFRLTVRRRVRGPGEEEEEQQQDAPQQPAPRPRGRRIVRARRPNDDDGLPPLVPRRRPEDDFMMNPFRDLLWAIPDLPPPGLPGLRRVEGINIPEAALQRDGVAARTRAQREERRRRALAAARETNEVRRNMEDSMRRLQLIRAGMMGPLPANGEGPNVNLHERVRQLRLHRMRRERAAAGEAEIPAPPPLVPPPAARRVVMVQRRALGAPRRVAPRLAPPRRANDRGV